MRVAPWVLALALIGAPGAVSAQQTTVTGVVVDTLSMPIAGVLVFVDDGQPVATTDSLGMFRLDPVARGPHRLSYRSAGYTPRTFNLQLQPDDAELDVGGVVLRPGAAPSASLTGIVTETVGGQPLAGAVVEINGRIVAQTDSTGTFGVPSLPILWGPNVVRVTHRAFAEAQTTDQFFIANPDETIDLAVSLDVAPVALPGVDVAARAPALSPRLQARGFYERMEQNSNGVFWTAEQILERDPDDWDDLIRSVRFPRTRAATSFGRSQTGDCGRTAYPLVFIDGSYVGSLDPRDRDGRTLPASPSDVEGVEIYRGIAGLPMEFNLMGAECGVIVVWTRGTF